MLGSPRSKAKSLTRSLRREGQALRALVSDPVQSRSYYPELPRKPKARILAELLWWWIRYREANQYYYLYGLDRAGAKAETILPYRHFRAMRNTRNLRPAQTASYYGGAYNYVCLMRDKFLFSQLMGSLGFPVPKTFALLSSEGIHWIDSGRRSGFDALLSEDLSEIDAVCKPSDGIMGKGLFLVRAGRGRLAIDGHAATPDELQARLSRPYLLQERVSQDPALAKLHPQSTNTLRLVTYNEAGRISLFSASLRVGTGGRPADNWSSGGILLAVDPNSGRVRGEGFMKPTFGLRVACHPDSGVVFDGFVVPRFFEAVDLVKACHSLLPGLHSIGWDVAVTPEGPVLLEGNDDWDGAIPMLFDPDFKMQFMAKYA